LTPDPDPTPFLFVSVETKRADMLKPYDAKKSVWVPDEEGGYSEAMVLQPDDGKKVVVLIGHEVKIFSRG
jgi:myosin heavy chain 6/7